MATVQTRWNNLFANQLSTQGNNTLLRLQGQHGDVNNAVAASVGGSIQWSSGWLSLLELIDALTPNPNDVRHGANVTAEDAALTAAMVGLSQGRRLRELTLADSVDRMAAGQLVVIGGADAAFDAFVGDASRLQTRFGGKDLVLQYVGLDAEHWRLPDAVGLLEVNLLKTAALLLVNAALNDHGRKSTIVSTGFATWLVNRAMRALPRAAMAGARNLQIDAVGPLEALQELTVVKLANYGRICNARSAGAAHALTTRFAIAAGDLAHLPVDVQPKAPTPGSVAAFA